MESEIENNRKFEARAGRKAEEDELINKEAWRLKKKKKKRCSIQSIWLIHNVKFYFLQKKLYSIPTAFPLQTAKKLKFTWKVVLSEVSEFNNLGKKIKQESEDYR